MKKEKISILIPDAQSGHTLQVLYCLNQVPEFRVNLLSSDPRAIVRYSLRRGKFIVHDSEVGGTDIDRLAIIKDAAKETHSRIILPIDEPAIRLMAIYGEELPQTVMLTPNPSQKVFDTVNDKGRFANFLDENRIPSPITILIHKKSEMLKDISRLRFPILVKPTQGAGGKGIRIFKTLSELELFIGKESLNWQKYIFQSYVHGYDIDCSVLCKNGEILAYTIQKGFISNKDEFGPPAGVDFLYNEKVYIVVCKLVRALNWSGVAHIDLRYDIEDDQAKVIEINPRYWGSLIGSLIAGVNFPSLACKAALGEDFPLPRYDFKTYVNHKARLMLIKKWLQGKLPHNSPMVGDTGIKYLLKDPLPEVYKLMSGHGRQ